MELLTNPFFTLGATMRDDKRRIMDLAEEKSLVSDEEAVRDATAVLTNPRRRLAAEIGWLPGLGPKRTSDTISLLQREPTEVRYLEHLPSLARANLLADGLILGVEQLPQREVALWIVELAHTHDEIEAEQTLMVLNEERSVAGFPAISDMQIMDAELQERRQYYRQAIKRALGELPAPSLVDTVTAVVDEATDHGNHQAPILIDDVVDSFEVEVQEFFEKETKNIFTIEQDIREAVKRGETHEYIEGLVLQLEKVVKNWDWVAQPIQVSCRSRGIDHDLSHEVAGKIRNLAVELFNEYGLLEISKHLTILQQKVFAEIDQVVEILEDDASALDEIANWKLEMEKSAEAWRRDITYEADVGVIFKDKLRISPDGVQWKGLNISLEEIKRVRWSGTKSSMGAPYSIFVGGKRGGITIELRKQNIYLEFIERLWKAAGAHILTEMLEGLHAGKRYKFGTVVVTDYGVELERLPSTNERIPCKWTDITIASHTGIFYIVKKSERGVGAVLPYMEWDNVNILEFAIRIFLKNPGPRLSDLLNEAN